MIVHQNVSANVNFKTLRHFTNGIQKQITIFIVDNDIAPFVSPGQNVIQSTFIFDSPCTRHKALFNRTQINMSTYNH